MKQRTEDLAVLGKGAGREVQGILRELNGSGNWTGRKTGGNHIALYHRDGGMVVVASTPSDKRAMRNARAVIKRIEREAA